ncbi:uncharacterized protein MELLADRAFT_72934 [Melampsora larici-populina 98AG31]|uniref:Protein CPL1-like domain-containing protein n=1 Tax=Melampsora larici-populina (strain 98AG31 / pathotype 3-4-7) TaxID=747676 RepID=F4S0Z9_MELLP|nr:uncharacterized protein MELLADRAFT_72934 [Melampsora larici-populina 98AG31]EGG01680.1 hypothetical protein MELLADRAFT_72934 [Melampsora larici-populina 98AG31]
MNRYTIVAVFIGSLMANAMAKSYKANFDSVNSQMSELYQHIGDVQAIASSSGHSEIQKKCSEAKDALDFAQSSWQQISTTYINRPWLASENSLSSTIKSRLSDCGNILKEIQEHSDVQSNTNAYSRTVQACQTIYTKCVSSCDGIWDWQPPSPQPSGSSNRKLRRSLYGEQVPACPNNETACPISHLSLGFECIDTNLELASCGGCVTKGEGENCLSITGAAGVGCLEGKCVVFSAESGYYLGQQGRPLRRRRML